MRTAKHLSWPATWRLRVWHWFWRCNFVNIVLSNACAQTFWDSATFANIMNKVFRCWTHTLPLSTARTDFLQAIQSTLSKQRTSDKTSRQKVAICHEMTVLYGVSDTNVYMTDITPHTRLVGRLMSPLGTENRLYQGQRFRWKFSSIKLRMANDTVISHSLPFCSAMTQNEKG